MGGERKVGGGGCAQEWETTCPHGGIADLGWRTERQFPFQSSGTSAQTAVRGKEDKHNSTNQVSG